MTLRKKIALVFLLLVMIPILIIYSIALYIFNRSNRLNLQSLYANNITVVGQGVNRYFKDALDLSIYPLMEKNLRAFLTTPADSTQYLSNMQSASASLSSMPYGFSNGIRSYVLMNREGAAISTGIETGISEEEATAALALEAKPLWSVTGRPQDLPGSGGSIQLTRALNNPINISQPTGFVKVCLSKEQLAQFLLEGATGDDTTFYILDGNGAQLLQTSTPRDAPLPLPSDYIQLTRLAHARQTQVLDGGLFVSAHSIAETPFLLCSVVRPSSYSLIGGTLLTGFSIAAVFMAGCSVALVFVFSHSVTAPLAALGTKMESISNEDYKVRASATGRDEISLLADRFNHMADRLDFLYNQVYLGELALKQAQLGALQMQINPHFLYNTLDTIYWMAQLGKTQQVSDMVSNLSQMMRFTLSPDSEDLVPLGKELHHLNCYLGIQRIRYGEGVLFDIRCDEALHGCMVQKLMLQPLVENALLHGLGRTGQGTIGLWVFRLGEDKLVCEVRNDGALIDVAEIDRLIERPEEGNRGFALRNIAQRIKLQNGEDYELSYFVEDGFSVFRITQQYRESGPEV